MYYAPPYSHHKNSIVGRLEDKDRWIKIERCECPLPYINIYGLRTLLNTVDDNRITRCQTNKISLLSTILHYYIVDIFSVNLIATKFDTLEFNTLLSNIG